MQTRSKANQTSGRPAAAATTTAPGTAGRRSTRSSARGRTSVTRKSTRLLKPATDSGSNRQRPSTSPVKRKAKWKTLVPAPRSDVCNFCLLDTADDYLLGELKTCDDITAHKFCLYFSPGLSQNGEPSQGLWGFLPEDIRKELRRGMLLKCSYCHKKGAVVGCSVPECLITYHLPCGMQNDAFMQYHDQQLLYPSYCRRHRPKMNVPSMPRRILCTVCQEYMKNAERDQLLYVQCCHSYYHRECLKKVAYHQGEFNLKCPNCNNSDEFVATVKLGGIYVPCRDSTWEISGEVSLNEVVFQCSAEECRCQQGRNFNGDDEWELFSCDRCGGKAVHVACASGLLGRVDNTEWFCDVCQSI